MQRADEPIPDAPSRPGHPEGPRGGAVSIALLATVALVPLVVAVGFLSDRGSPAVAAVPDDIALAALRGVLDADRGRPPAPRPRAAGF